MSEDNTNQRHKIMCKRIAPPREEIIAVEPMIMCRRCPPPQEAVPVKAECQPMINCRRLPPAQEVQLGEPHVLPAPVIMCFAPPVRPLEEVTVTQAELQNLVLERKQGPVGDNTK
eukprot:TRINITY_DN16279_c0_g1_i1.p1 TRINITY_DN16279_c0_g1~~TRINITY_DN16279_c0_g1_i1.p1  ORF type:complete len:129 (-),score=26.53 TRINITY_DN16279_c0_g1_i1:89-433(-)